MNTRTDKNRRIIYLLLVCNIVTIILLIYVTQNHWIPIIKNIICVQGGGGFDDWPLEKKPFAENNKTYREREMLFMHIYPDTDIDLCCLGDSITQKIEWQDVFPAINVCNRGIGSDTTEGLLARLDSVAKTNPKTISLMIGINDISQGRTIDEIENTYSKLLDTLHILLPNTRLIANSVLPVAAGCKTASNKTIMRLNKSIEKLCKEKDICFIDMYDSFVDEEGNLRHEYAIDDVHLSLSGFLIWIDHLRAVLGEV